MDRDVDIEVDNKVIIKSVGGNTVGLVILTGSSWRLITAGINSDIIRMIMIIVISIYGNIIIVNKSINQTSTRLGKDNISNLYTDIGAVFGLVLGTESGIDLGAERSAALGLALGSGLSSGLGSLLGIGFVSQNKRN